MKMRLPVMTRAALSLIYLFIALLHHVHCMEFVIIKECQPYKYYWRQSSPGEFYACLKHNMTAVKLRCPQGRVMCSTEPEPFQPCACDGEDKSATSINDGGGVAKKVSGAGGGGAKGMSDSSSLFDSSGEGAAEDRRQQKEGVVSLLKSPSSSSSFKSRASGRDATAENTSNHRAQKAEGGAAAAAAGGNTCTEPFTIHRNKHMFRGQVVPHTTLTLCQRHCLAIPHCFGFDWDRQPQTPADKRCFLILPPSLAAYGRQPRDNDCCDHYRRKPGCSNQNEAGAEDSLSNGDGNNDDDDENENEVGASLSPEGSGNEAKVSISKANSDHPAGKRNPTSLTSDSDDGKVEDEGNQEGDSEGQLDSQLAEETSNLPVDTIPEGQGRQRGLPLTGIPVGREASDDGRQNDATEVPEAPAAAPAAPAAPAASTPAPAPAASAAAPAAPALAPAPAVEDGITPSTVPFGTTTIPDTGCPFTFERINSASHPFGVNVTAGDANDEAEECKHWCIMRSFCAAVDFDSVRRTCYYVREAKQALLANISGVTHYRKVQCAPPLRCWSQRVTLESEDHLSITNPSTAQVHCFGICFVRQTLAASSTVIERGCQTVNFTHPAPALGCSVDSALMGVTCYCDTPRCNGLSIGAHASQLLHLPLDGDLTDHSGLRHDGTVPAGYESPAYTCLDRAVNCSALFTGRECVTIPSLASAVWGSMDDGGLVPQASFLVWFKRISSPSAASPSLSGIFGNSAGKRPPTWRIVSEDLGDYVAGGVQTTNASTQTLDDYQYVYAVKDQWHLVALTYTGLLNATLGQFPLLRFYVDGLSTMGNARSDKGAVEVSNEPVTVGCVQNQNFAGFIDEVRIFSTALDVRDIQALIAMRESNFW